MKTHQNLWVYAEDEESGQLKEQRKQVTATELKEEGNRLLKEGQLEEAHLLWIGFPAMMWLLELAKSRR